MYATPPTPPESASTTGNMLDHQSYVRERRSLPASFEPLQTVAASSRSDAACQSDSTLGTWTPRLPPIANLFQKADECERKRPSPPFAPRFPGPLAAAPILGYRRPTSAHGHLGYHAPRPEHFQRVNAASPVLRERRPSSTPCLPTPPAFQSTFPSPPISPQDLPHATPKIVETARAPLSFVRQQRRPVPYPAARGMKPSTTKAPRWHKWWMAPGAYFHRCVWTLC